MKPINIKAKCAAEKLQKELDAVQHRCSVRTITVNDIQSMAAKIEKEFKFIPKKALEGSKYAIDKNAQDFPNAYKYEPQSTQVLLERKSGKWYVTDIFRGETNTTCRRYTVLKMPDEMKEAITDAYKFFW